jgi:hypothetical protein
LEGGSSTAQHRCAKAAENEKERTPGMMFNIRILLKAIGALVIAAIVSPSLAGEFTVHSGKRYRATLSLNAVERLTDNALIARKFRAMGFSKVRVSGAGAVRRVEGVWTRRDASASLPRQIVAVARL